MPTDLISAREAAQLLGVSRATIGRYVKRELLPAQRLPGGQLRFSRADVASLLTRQQKEAHDA